MRFIYSENIKVLLIHIYHYTYFGYYSIIQYRSNKNHSKSGGDK